ncbi:MAG TPA: hypothetical protein VI932_06900 [Bacteroidota bacterium]|nr:hypothetical protein [Bacteroidota bacterium]
MNGTRSATAKTALLLIVLGAITWLGGINVRAAAGFSLLQFGTLEFKPNIHPNIERAVFSLLAQSSLILNVAYIVLILASAVYLRSARWDFRKEGWLMIAAILLYVFVPVEIYTMVLDIRMWLLDASGSNDLVEFRKLFIHRLAALSGVPMIALLSYYTAIALVVFRPLRRQGASRTAP